jgi:Holliday junction resolvasome RuvABC endonuclease subunit
MQEIESIIDNFDIDFLVYERGYSRRKISLVAGVIIGIAISKNIDYSSSSPAHMKKVITGNGRCGKELIAEKLAELYNINVSEMTDHETDSIGHIYTYLLDEGLIEKPELEVK